MKQIPYEAPQADVFTVLIENICVYVNTPGQLPRSEEEEGGDY